MPITQTVCTSYKTELINGTHNFATDTLMIALYTNSATLDASTTVYTTSGEVSGTGYTAGGRTLTGFTQSSTGTIAFVDFSDVTWTSATITARGALIYNASKGNKAIAVLDFGADISSTGGDFIVVMPANNSTNAIIRYS